MNTRIIGMMVTMLLVTVALPPSGANHTVPDNTQLHVGLATCKSLTQTDGAFSNPARNGIIRVTDNGVLSITAGVETEDQIGGCRVKVSFPGTFTVHGARPEGGLQPLQEGVCTAYYQQPCTTTPAKARWNVTFMDTRGKATIAIQIDYKVTVYSVTNVAGTEVEQEVAFFTGFIEITEPSIPQLSTPVDGLQPASSLDAIKATAPPTFARSEPQSVSGDGLPGALSVSATSCQVNYEAVGHYYYWFRGKVPGAGCTAGTASVLCCSWVLILGITEGFQGTAKVTAQFSGGATHTFTCTWTAPAGAGIPTCNSNLVGQVFVGDTLTSLKGEATGRSGTGSWSLIPGFQSPF